MSRYLIDGLLGDMRSGRRVLFVARRNREAQEMFNAVLRAGLRGDEACRRTNGSLRIMQADGSGLIDFRASGSNGHRGMDADVLVLQDAREFKPDEFADLQPCLRASRAPKAETLVCV